MGKIGTMSMGVETPIMHEGDDIIAIVVDSILEASKESGIPLSDGDILGITESLLARTQGNYITIEDISSDIKEKFNKEEVGVLFPIMSRNRFGNILKGIALGANKVYVQLSYPFDEVGNPLIDQKTFYEKDIEDKLYTKEEFKKLFSNTTHPFTGVDYIDYYSNIAPNIEIVLSNDPKSLLSLTKNILISSIHRRDLDRWILKKEDSKATIYDLTEVLNKPSKEHGYNENYGLLGSNMSDENRLKLFPRDGKIIVDKVQKIILDKTGKKIEVLIYGDGAFKDPMCGIWELADPVVSPFHTKGLEGLPSEMKLKYLADTKGLKEEEIIKLINNNKNINGALGTTPRRIVDLVGSLCDLTSGSGDKGTPVVWVKNYSRKYNS